MSVAMSRRTRGVWGVPRGQSVPPGKHSKWGGRAAGHHQAAGRGRGGVGLGALRRPAPARAGAAGLRRDRDQRHHHVGRRRAVHVHRHARAAPGRGHADRAGPGPALRLVRRRGAEPAARDGEPAGRPARRAGPYHPAPVLRPGAAAVGGGAGPAGPAAVRREAVARRRGREWRGPRRAGLQHAGADLGPADRRGQRHVGRPHRARLQDHHPAGRARQGLLPPGRRPGSRRRGRSLPRVRGRPHAGRPDGHGDRPSRRAPLPLADHLPGRAGRAPRDAAGVRPRGAVHHGRRQRPGSGPGRDPRRTAGVPRGRPGFGPDPRAERERGPVPPAARRRGLGVPLGRASRRGPQVTPLESLALARGTVDRVTHRRNDKQWLDDAWADPRTRVLVVSDGRALARFDDDEHVELVLVSPAEAPPGVRFLLGQDADGVVYFGVSADLPAPPPGTRPASLREVGVLLGDRDAGLFTHAVALANWHDTHTHCPLDGTPTIPDPGGHSTRCPADGTEHFPRTDPAVIMLVTDPDDRCLLARNAAWPGRRVSILAGFVEPGESAEQAVIREVAEETQIKVTNVRYVGSQPWPMPRSLMLGFRAEAPAGQAIIVDREEIAEAYWFSRDELLAAIKAREIALPPPVSIARRIIEDWFGGPLPSTWTEILGPVPSR